MIETFGGYTLDAIDTYRGEGWPGGVVRDLIAALKHERGARVVLKEAAKKQGERLDSLYADSMISHRWFEAAFGEDFRGRDFAAKCPMAEERLQQIRQERDHFGAAYARKLDEHSATLSDAAQLCNERDEARAKLAATEAHCATLRAALEPFAEAAKYWVDAPGTITHDNVQMWQRGRRIDYLTCGELRAAAAALAATPTDSLARVREQVRAEILPVVQEAAAGLDPNAVAIINEGGALLRAEIRREAIREWCEAIQNEAITSWLDHTPEPLGPGDLLKRLLFAAGRDRAVQELDALIENTKRFGHSVTLAASTEPWDFSSKTEQALLLTFLEQRRDEIAKEGK